MSHILRKLPQPRFKVGIDADGKPTTADLDTLVYAYLKERVESQSYHEWVRNAIRNQYLAEKNAVTGGNTGA